jgi:hypothetical protein
VTTPVAPCSPDATVAFLEARFGPEVAKAIDPASRLAAARQRRILEMRRGGQLRHAERFGWLSLAAWVLGVKPAVIGRLDPTSRAIVHRSSARDVLPDPLGADQAPNLAAVGDSGLEASDPRDPLGFRVFELAVAATGGPLVEVEGATFSAGALASALRARLEEAGRG